MAGLERRGRRGVQQGEAAAVAPGEEKSLNIARSFWFVYYMVLLLA